MTKDDLQKLYKSKILPENEHPYHFQEIKSFDFQIEAYNPMCGDKYWLFFEQHGNQISNVFFHGFGCALSKASLSLLCKSLEGMPHKDAIELSRQFVQCLTTDLNFEFKKESLNTLAELKHFEGRVDCIKLGWEAVCNHFENYEN